ncbi:MAG: VWA domain-containing protein [Bacteroidota bacterium]
MKYTYRNRAWLLAILGWEVVFWILFFAFVEVLGVFSQSRGEERLELLQPDYGWLFLLIPLLGAAFGWMMYQRHKLVSRLPEPELVSTFLRPVSTLQLFWRYFLLRNALAFVVIALMQPAFGSKEVKATANGVELIFAVDISNSMNTRDIEDGSTRLTAAQRAMHQFVNQSSTAKIGLLVFAGNVYPQLPLTADKAAAKMHIDELSTSMISNQGTNIAAVLEESKDFFSEDDLKKTLVLITDGEDHEGGMDAVLDELVDKNIQLLVLGIGSEKGGLVPRSEAVTNQYFKDDMGRTVISKVDRSMIADIARRAEGDHLVSNAAFPNVNQLLTQINSSKSTKEVDLEFNVKENRYQWPLFAGLLMLFLLLIGELISWKMKEKQVE